MNRLFLAVAAFWGLLSVAWFTGCSTINAEAELPDQSLTSLVPPGKVRLVFFNASQRALYLVTGPIGIEVDGVGVETIDIGHYVQIDVTPGVHTLDLGHVDLITFRNSYSITARGDLLYIRVYCTPTQTKYEIVGTSMPPHFESKFQKIPYLK
jgi:hypothetical protein